MAKINYLKLWAFLEKWTRPNDENAYPEWKKELDNIFVEDE